MKRYHLAAHLSPAAKIARGIVLVEFTSDSVGGWHRDHNGIYAVRLADLEFIHAQICDWNYDGTLRISETRGGLASLDLINSEPGKSVSELIGVYAAESLNGEFKSADLDSAVRKVLNDLCAQS